MKVMENRLNDQENYEIVVNKLKSRGVSLNDIANLVLDLQRPYFAVKYFLYSLKPYLSKSESGINFKAAEFIQ